MNAFLTQPGISTVRPFRSSICARRCRKRNTFVRSAGRVVMCSVSDSNERVSIGDMQESNLDDPNLIVNADDSDSEFDDDLDLVDIQTQKTAKKRTRKQVEQLEAEINVPIDNTYTSDADTIPSIQDDEFTKYIRTAVMAADQRKGGDILALRISKLTYISSFLVIATGKSPPQLRAIANLVEDQLGKQHGLSPRRIDGVPNSGWVLIDYGDFMINIFSPAQRKNYNLEKLWGKAENIDISDWLAEPTEEPNPIPSAASLDDWLDE